MAVKIRNVLVQYDPTTKALAGIQVPEKELTRVEATAKCVELNPPGVDTVTYRVGTLVVEE